MTYTPPVYPGTLPDGITDLPDRKDDLDWFLAARYNELKKELVACLKELGTDPAGSETDLKTRLAVSLDDAGVLKTTLEPTFKNLTLTEGLICGGITSSGASIFNWTGQFEVVGGAKIRSTVITDTFHLGYLTTVTGDYGAVAFNRSTTASGRSSAAFGRSTVASADSAVAMGNASIANGINSLAVGKSITSANYTIAMGFEAEASGAQAIALGREIDVSGIGSFGISLGNPASQVQITANGVMGIMGGNVGIDFATPLSKVAINGGLHVGGASDAGDNNLLVDGNATIDNNVIFNNTLGTFITRGVFVKSHTINYDTSGLDQAIMTVDDGWVITQVYAKITEVWDGNGTVTVGDTDDADGYLTWTDMDSGLSTGYKGLARATRGAYLDASGEVKAYSSSKIIAAVVTPGTSTQGSMEVYAVIQKLK